MSTCENWVTSDTSPSHSVVFLPCFVYGQSKKKEKVTFFCLETALSFASCKGNTAWGGVWGYTHLFVHRQIKVRHVTWEMGRFISFPNLLCRDMFKFTTNLLDHHQHKCEENTDCLKNTVCEIQIYLTSWQCLLIMPKELVLTFSNFHAKIYIFACLCVYHKTPSFSKSS